MLGRISALLAKNQIVTVDLLKEEFNTSDTDVTCHINELIGSHILREYKPVIEESLPSEKTKRVESAKSSKTVTRTTKTLKSVGLLSQRFATKLDTEKNAGLKPRQSIYDFKGTTNKPNLIDNHFIFYAAILNDTLTKAVRKNIPQVERYLNRKDSLVA